jgi:peptide/nickel transport system permease protein
MAVSSWRWSGVPGSARAGALMLSLIAGMALCADVMAPGPVFASSAPVLQPPSWAHPFGTDDLGRDLFRTVVHGARVSIVVGVGAASTALLIGFVIGSGAGYAGGTLDDILMRTTELFQVMPRLFLVLTAVALFGSSLGLIVLIIGLTSWPGVARLVRGQTLTIRTLDHVAAARAAGASASRVLTRHIWPAMQAPVTAQAAFQASGAILLEAGISFLGLGDPSVVTWGALLHDAHHFLRVAWWMAAFPGLALTLTVLGLHLVADHAGAAA